MARWLCVMQVARSYGTFAEQTTVECDCTPTNASDRQYIEDTILLPNPTSIISAQLISFQEVTA